MIRRREPQVRASNDSSKICVIKYDDNNKLSIGEIKLILNPSDNPRVVQFDSIEKSGEIYEIIVGEEIDKSNIDKACFKHISSIKLPNSEITKHTASLTYTYY